jgi:hypothetical protein
MSEAMRMWVEISFNVVYLVVAWGMVVLMTVQRDRVAPEDRPVTRRFVWAFALLALGDTGHVGFRVLAYALGGLEATPVVLGVPISLVGLGALATAVTVTFFYVLVLDAWRVRYHARYGWFEYILLAAAALRLAIMVFPANQWDSVVPPQPWSMIRNAPLTLLGLGTAWLILRDARRHHDRTFVWVGVMILVSYACYLPVVLFVQQNPLLGMLMIPKTLAYVAIAFIVYCGLYRRLAPVTPQQPALAP